MSVVRVRERAAVLNVLVEWGVGEGRSKELADKLIEALYPREWEEFEDLEDCYSCGTKGHIIVHVEHPKTNSASAYDVLCGRCYGTGKLPKVAMEYR